MASHPVYIKQLRSIKEYCPFANSRLSFYLFHSVEDQRSCESESLPRQMFHNYPRNIAHLSSSE